MDETSRIFKDLKRMVKIMNSQKDLDHSYIKNIFRLVHTLKANAGLFGFVSIQKVRIPPERMLLDLEVLGGEIKEPVIEMINNQIKALSEEIYSYTTLRREIFEFTHRREVEVEKYRLQWAKILSKLDYHVRSGDIDRYEILFKHCFSAISNLEKVSLKDYFKRLRCYGFSNCK